MKTETKVPTMIGISKVSELTGINYDRIREMCLRNEIVYIKIGNRYLINFEKFIDYLNGER